jgi:hypothetical protein
VASVHPAREGSDGIDRRDDPGAGIASFQGFNHCGVATAIAARDTRCGVLRFHVN